MDAGAGKGAPTAAKPASGEGGGAISSGAVLSPIPLARTVKRKDQSRDESPAPLPVPIASTSSVAVLGGVFMSSVASEGSRNGRTALRGRTSIPSSSLLVATGKARAPV